MIHPSGAMAHLKSKPQNTTKSMPATLSCQSFCARWRSKYPARRFGSEKPTLQGVRLRDTAFESRVAGNRSVSTTLAALVLQSLSHGTIFGDSAETLFKRDTSPSQIGRAHV